MANILLPQTTSARIIDSPSPVIGTTHAQSYMPQVSSLSPSELPPNSSGAAVNLCKSAPPFHQKPSSATPGAGMTTVPVPQPQPGAGISQPSVAARSAPPPPMSNIHPGMAGRTKGCIHVGFYDIDKTIGKGNFATVKLARHRVTKSRVALKIIKKSQLDESELQKTYREISILKQLSHINIVRLYQVMESKNMLYLVTEHASNGELFEFLAEHGRMEEPEAQRIFWQIVLAVEYCHQQGIVHRDLKVENLLFDSYWDIKIADFGFSNTYLPNKLLDTWCGSPPYAAPEIFAGLNYDGEKLDIWSMGVILYVLVCGCLPFDGDSLQVLRERVLSGRYRVPYFLSRNCESLIQRMLVLEPSKRYSVKQIKSHTWMQRDSEEDVYNGCSSVNRSDAPLDENVLQAMKSVGLDREKTIASVSEKKYDNYYAIYYLLLDKVANSGPIPLSVKTTPQSHFSSSYDSMSLSSNISSMSLDQRSEKETLDKDRGLMRQKSCSPKGSIGTPSIDEGFSSDVSFEADASVGKESSMELQMTPIKEDPEREHYQRSVSSDSQVSLDFDTSLQAHQFSLLKLPPPSQQPSMQAIAESVSPPVAPIVPSQMASMGLNGQPQPIGVAVAGGAAQTSYDEVSGERMLVNLAGHSNFSSLESQCSEYSSNISLDTNHQLKGCSLSPQVSISRPPLVHQQRIGDCFQTGFLTCGRRASESNLNEQETAAVVDANPKNMKHQIKPYDIQTLRFLEANAQNFGPIAHTMLKQQSCLNESLSTAVVSSAPGSPQIPKRLMKQRPVSADKQQALSSAVNNPIPSAHLLSPHQMTFDAISNSPPLPAATIAHRNTIGSYPGSSPFNSLNSATAMRSNFLPKPRSFDEAQSRTVGGFTNELGSATSFHDFEDGLTNSRHLSLDGHPPRLQHQSSTEDQSGDDLLGLHQPQPTPGREKLLKTRGRRMQETSVPLHMDSPYSCKPQSNSLSTAQSLSRRNTFQRQLTMRQQHLFERQSSKCSNSPPRMNPGQDASSGFTSPIPSLAASFDGVSSNLAHNYDLPCLLQQMELRNTPSPLPGEPFHPVAMAGAAPVAPNFMTRSAASPGLRYKYHQYYHANPAFSASLSSAMRHQLSGPIPSISFESADGQICYLEQTQCVQAVGLAHNPTPGSGSPVPVALIPSDIQSNASSCSSYSTVPQSMDSSSEGVDSSSTGTTETQADCLTHSIDVLLSPSLPDRRHTSGSSKNFPPVQPGVSQIFHSHQVSPLVTNPPPPLSQHEGDASNDLQASTPMEQ